MIFALCGIALLGLGALALTFYPLAPTDHTTRTVASLGTWVGRASAGPTAVIYIDGRRVEIRLPTINACTVGGRIHLSEQRRLWGLAVSPELTPCDPEP